MSGGNVPVATVQYTALLALKGSTKTSMLCMKSAIHNKKDIQEDSFMNKEQWVNVNLNALMPYHL